jgi:hypothetical protein
MERTMLAAILITFTLSMITLATLLMAVINKMAALEDEYHINNLSMHLKDDGQGLQYRQGQNDWAEAPILRRRSSRTTPESSPLLTIAR